MRKPNINGTQLVVWRLGPVSRKRKIPGQSSAQPKSGVASDPPPNVGGTVASATLRRTPATKFLPIISRGRRSGPVRAPHAPPPDTQGRRPVHPHTQPVPLRTYLSATWALPGQAPCLPARPGPAAARGCAPAHTPCVATYFVRTGHVRLPSRPPPLCPHTRTRAPLC